MAICFFLGNNIESKTPIATINEEIIEMLDYFYRQKSISLIDINIIASINPYGNGTLSTKKVKELLCECNYSLNIINNIQDDIFYYDLTDKKVCMKQIEVIKCINKIKKMCEESIKQNVGIVYFGD